MLARRFARAFTAASVALTVLFASAPGNAAPNDTCGPARTDRCEYWVAHYNGSAGLSDRGTAIAVNPWGDTIFVTGSAVDSTGAQNFVTLAYDASFGDDPITHAPIWKASYDGPGSDTDEATAITTDGFRVYVTGFSTGAGTGWDYTTIAYDAFSGEQVWVARDDGALSTTDRAQAIALSKDGSLVFITGYQTADAHLPGNNLDGVTIAYNSETGEQVWKTTYDGPASAWDVPDAIGVAQTSAGERVIVTSRSNVAGTANGQTDFVTIAYDAQTGEQAWLADYNGPGNDREYPYALDVSGDGTRVYVTGESAGTGTALDYATVSYDTATGSERWVARYDGGFNDDDRPLSVAVAPQGDRVYVTGFSAGSASNFNRATVTTAYDDTGTQLWVDRHDQPGGGAASKVLVGPDGNHVYVAGLSVGQNVGAGVNGVSPNATVDSFETYSLAAATGTLEWIGHLHESGQPFGAVMAPNRTRVFEAGGQDDVVTLSYDTGVPAPPVSLPTLTVNPTPINSVNRTAITLSGTADPNVEVIPVLSDGPTGSDTTLSTGIFADANGNYSWTTDASSLKDGHIDARVRAIDRYGSYTDFRHVDVLKDTVAATPGLSVPQAFGTSMQTAVPFSGSAEPGSHVTVTLSDGTTTVSKTVFAANGSYATQLDASAFGDGALTATATDIDANGNTSTAATAITRKDTVAPAAPVITGPVDGAGLTSATVRLSGTSDANTTVVLSEGTAQRATSSAQTGAWAVDVGFSNGSHAVTARARDAAGNLSPSASVGFTVTSEAPAVPVITTPAADAILTQTSVTVAGTATPKLRVRVSDGTKALVTVTVSNAGIWSTNVTLKEGPHSLTAVALDAGGTPGATSDARAFVIDTTAPTVAIATTDAGPYLAAPAISGSAADNNAVARVSVSFANALGANAGTSNAACTNCGTNAATWSVTPTLSPGRYTAKAISYDAAGHASEVKSFTFTTL